MKRIKRTLKLLYRIYLDLLQYQYKLVTGAKTRVLEYRLDLRRRRVRLMRVMVRRVPDLVARVRRVRQRRRVLMVRRRGRVAVMMMGRRVYVAVTVAHRMRVVRSGGAVHVVQQVVVSRQRVVLQVKYVRQEGLAAPLMELQVTV